MRLDKLELDLQPRSNAQALDLGFTLLRAHAADTYLAWLGLWLPLMGVCTALGCIWQDYAGIFLFVPWWFRPILERAPLYVLSRQVFGEQVGWRDALRAWPKQLGGGWIYLLTWGRFFCAGRALYQPIWQLEGARGRVAAERRKIIGKSNTARSSYWFGIACANFEMILQFGLLLFIGIFASSEETINPFILFKKLIDQNGSPGTGMLLLGFLGTAIAGAIIGPIYTACGFTLYLNRRALLEAWDLEIVLRQIKPPQHKGGAVGANARAASVLALLCGATLLLPMLLAAPSAHAQQVDNPAAPVSSAGAGTSTSADASTGTGVGVAPAAAPDPASGKCEPPAWIKKRELTRQEAKSQEQTDLRHEVEQIYDTDDLRGYRCEYQWGLKHKEKEQEKQKPEKLKYDQEPGIVSVLSMVLKVLLIAMLIGIVGAFLYRYRGQLAAFGRGGLQAKATEVAGMDIRPESLPDDVAKQVAALWQRGQRRAALALLYRATISRLVNDNHLPLTHGATEGDCLRQVLQAQRRQELTETRSSLTRAVTDVWLNAAYADRWPSEAVVVGHCHAWRSEFDQVDRAGQANQATAGGAA
jgi:hypothetical protein